MNKLKRPELKMPPFVVDLFYDLRDHHLFPLIAVIAVAIVAAPFLLSSSTKPPPSSAELGAALARQPGAGASQLTVTAESPGLRDYRKRLSDLRAKDPFKQHFTGPVLKGAGPKSSTTTTTSTSAGSGASGGSSTSVSTPTVTSPPVSSSPTGGGPSSSGGQAPAKLIAYTVDVRIVHDGKAQVRRDVPTLTMLPSKKVPAVMFMGVSADGKRALLLVSSDVASVFGDAKCSLGSQTCDLLEVEPGFPEAFVYGPQSQSYRIEVLRVNRIAKSATQAKGQSGKATAGRPAKRFSK